MFLSVFDTTSSIAAANPLFDISFGVSSESAANNTFVSESQRTNTYSGMAQVLLGYDENGDIKSFKDKTNNLKYHHLMFVSFARLIAKDELRRGQFSMKINVAPDGQTAVLKTITDAGADANYYIDSPVGDYGVLKIDTSSNPSTEVGFIFYQAGVVVLTTGIFATYNTSYSEETAGKINTNKNGHLAAFTTFADGYNIETLFLGGASTFSRLANSVYSRYNEVAFHNTTEINSTVYFCRANHNEFNYSSNPTYIKDSKIVVKNSTYDRPVSYITTVGLYSVDEELLAVAKLSEPIKKTPDDSILLRVRLDV